jgi:hypothetical protein
MADLINMTAINLCSEGPLLFGCAQNGPGDNDINASSSPNITGITPLRFTNPSLLSFHAPFFVTFSPNESMVEVNMSRIDGQNSVKQIFGPFHSGRHLCEICRYLK